MNAAPVTPEALKVVIASPRVEQLLDDYGFNDFKFV
jgi:hypothetical protein